MIKTKPDYTLFRRELSKRLYLANLRIIDLEEEVATLKEKLNENNNSVQPNL